MADSQNLQANRRGLEDADPTTAPSNPATGGEGDFASDNPAEPDIGDADGSGDTPTDDSVSPGDAIDGGSGGTPSADSDDISNV